MTRDEAFTLASSYEAAALYIETFGWHKGDVYPGWENSAHDDGSAEAIISYINTNHPPVCALGAGYAVGAFNAVDDPRVGEWVKPLLVELGGGYAPTSYTRPGLFVYLLPSFNDEDDTTAEDVIGLLRRTAQKIRAGFIGDNPREVEFEPMPETEPIKEPSPSPSTPTPAPAPAEPAPQEEPVPA